jgi:hypothetical protein
MAQEREAQPAKRDGTQQARNHQAGDEPAGSQPAQQSNANQVRDEPLPASHHDDGRAEPEEEEEESPAPGARGGQG